ncbi:hypothetical protein K1719_024597 [Acacia pycnantha]|nr:hypothetical protein K1719_024597 [Acacia pycnantha]
MGGSEPSVRVSLFKRLLLMERNLRAESDRMKAFEEKPLAGTDIASLFEDARVKADVNSITSKSIFREELVASLVESCFQLSLPLLEQKNSGMESRVIGALAYGTGYGALNWQSLLWKWWKFVGHVSNGTVMVDLCN